MSHSTPGPHPRTRPDPSNRPAVVQHAYYEVFARVPEWEAEFRVTRLEVVGCLLRAAGELNAGLVKSERGEGAAPTEGPPVVPGKADPYPRPPE
jgi:hypothetical protein